MPPQKMAPPAAPSYQQGAAPSAMQATAVAAAPQPVMQVHARGYAIAMTPMVELVQNSLKTGLDSPEMAQFPHIFSNHP